MGIAIHTNPGLKHQVKWGEALRQGFAVHNQAAAVTADRYQSAWLHVVQGPHYALEPWRHRRILYLDRCFYDDTNLYASIGWRAPDGSRDFKNSNSPPDRWRGTLAPWKQGEPRTALILADYNQREDQLRELASHIFSKVKLRRHPADEAPGEPLSTALAWADVAIGKSSTALVQAALAGVPLICLDPQNVARPVASHSFTEPLFRRDRRQWCYDLAYTQWHVDEITSGMAWKHLMDSV